MTPIKRNDITHTPVNFDDLEDDLDAATGPQTAEPVSPAKAVSYPVEEPQVYMDKCPACNGTGFYGRPSRFGARCIKCDGRGFTAYKTSPEERANRRASSAKRRENQADEWEAAFTTEYPQIAAWWTGSDFPFAVSMREAVRKYGHLTENQLAAALRCVDKLAEAKARREEQTAARAVIDAAAPVHDTGALEAAFARAKSKGLQRPGMTIGGLRITEAPVNGRNAGALYVKQEGEYLGKVVGGRFLAGRDCDEETRGRVDRILADPLTEAIAHGKQFGICAICSRELTDPESVARGIGPICAEKFFGV